MSSETQNIKIAAVQAASSFLDLHATVDKACQLIEEAGKAGARVIGFPECYVPGYPIWFQFYPDIGEMSNRLGVMLFHNSIEVPGPEVAQLQRAAKNAAAYVVLGICERVPGSNGTIYNSQLVLGPEGELISCRRKIMPTIGERLLFGYGDGTGLAAVNTPYGPLTSLICGENSNPLAIQTVASQHSAIHVMSWPNRLPTIAGQVLTDRVRVGAQAFAQMTKTHVLASCSVIDETVIEKLELKPEDEQRVRAPGFSGGTVIIGPDTRVLAEAEGSEEVILYATVDPDMAIRMKLRHDFAGHYNRPDIFQLTVNNKEMKLWQTTENEVRDAGASNPRTESTDWNRAADKTVAAPQVRP